MKLFRFRLGITILSLFCFSGNLWAMGKKPEKEKIGPERVSLSLGLWDSFDMALKRSETLAIKKEEVARTMSSFLHASGESIGDANFVMTEFRQDPQKGSSGSDGSTSSSLAFERRQRRFEISQPLFQGFRALGALSGAGSLKHQRQKEWERAKQLLFLDVVNSFYDYLRLNKDAEIIKGILALFQDRLKELKEWEDIGRSRPSESATARSRLESFNAELARSKGDLAIAGNLFAFLIGVAVEGNELKDEETPLSPEGRVNILNLAAQRPDVEASKAAVTTARGAVIVAQSDLWPKLTLDTNLYEKREGFQSGIDWDTLVTFSVPLGKGGTTIGEVRDAYSDWKEAKLTYSLTERTAVREIKDAYDGWQSSAERYRALEKAVQAAQENFTLQTDEYKRRLVSNLDVLEALQVLFETKRDANVAFYNAKKDYWKLEVAQGRCCEEIP